VGFSYRKGSCRKALKIPPLPSAENIMNSPVLTPEQEAEAQCLADRLMTRTREEVLQIARLLVSKPDHQLLGQTEFEIRDRVHKIGAHAIQTALNERKKGGTKGRA
jgi:hypothetical protein